MCYTHTGTVYIISSSKVLAAYTVGSRCTMHAPTIRLFISTVSIYAYIYLYIYGIRFDFDERM